ncbi:MAG: FliH/SctL family protein [Oscillospiraceae bacterium]|nr:FliH/SctL family protein [Oscillospiraceae bacterium]
MFSVNLIKKDSADTGLSYKLEEFYEDCEQEILEEDDNFCRQKADEILSSAKKKAEQIIKEAEQEAQSIILEADKNSNKIYLERYRASQQSGYSDGLAKGYAEVQDKAVKMMEEIENLCACFTEERDKIIYSSKKTIIDLATEIAKKITCDRFMAEDGAFLAIFEQVVKKLPAATKLTVTLADQDYQAMTFNQDKLHKLAEEFEFIEIHSDIGEERGTIKLETDSVYLDASLSKQIDMVKSNLIAL